MATVGVSHRPRPLPRAERTERGPPKALSAAQYERLGAAAELPDELRHPHALRHTCATELLRAGATLADVRVFLGHSSVKTTSIYLAPATSAKSRSCSLRERGRPTLDDDRAAA